MLITILGYALALFLGIKFIRSLWNIFYPHVIARIFGLGVDFRKLGDWAVITGSTDGIGKGFAIELAKKGLNVFLLSRSAEKLEKVKKEIESIAPTVEVRTHAIDFGTNDLTKYEEVGKILDVLDVGTLINNVGVDFGPGKFLDYPGGLNSLQNLINVNCSAAVLLTKILMPKMVKKGKGAVIMVSSGTAHYPVSYFSIYSASKSFIVFLTKAIQKEYKKNSGVFIQLVCPFMVRTNMTDQYSKEMNVPIPAQDPNSYAKSVLATVGIQEFTSGSLSHEIQYEISINWIPSWILARILSKESERISEKRKEN